MDLSTSLAHFEQRGYVVLPQALGHAQLNDFWEEVEQNISANQELTFALYGEVLKNRDVAGSVVRDQQVLRIIDLEDHSPKALDLMLAPPVTQLLNAWYGEPPTAIQTLTYKYGSQQGAHSDLHLVSPPTVGAYYGRESLAAAWFACEDADESNGALVIYPGSHRLLKRPLQSFGEDYGAWVRYLDTLCRERGCEPEIFNARIGDILLWHGDLVHAGGPIRDLTRTRKSFVVHYARIPDSARSPDPRRIRRPYLNGWHFGRCVA